MAVNSPVHGHPLPCGRLVESLFDDVEAGRTDDHTQACAHCVTARRGVENLAAATHTLAEEPTEPPAGLVERIMQVVRLELRRGEILPLPSVHGPADIAEHAVAAVLRYAADSVPGVRARSCRITPHPDRPGVVRVQMSLLVRYGAGPPAQVLGEVRRRVTAALTAQVGLAPGGIDLEVVDLWPEEDR
jgi:hypothetical protein